MFNLKHFKLVKELKNFTPQLNWLKFSGFQKTTTRNEFLDSLMAENKFIAEDLKLRAMVEDMIKKEFPERLKDKKNYDFLVDSVVNKLKKKQLGNISSLEEIE